MCLAVPGRVTSVNEAGDTGVVDFNGSNVEANISLLPDAKVGSWVLVHAGFAITRLEEEEARETWEYLRDAEIPECQSDFPVAL